MQLMLRYFLLLTAYWGAVPSNIFGSSHMVLNTNASSKKDFVKFYYSGVVSNDPFGQCNF